MKVFGRYLAYRLKQSWLKTLVFSVLSVMFCLFTTSSGIKAVEVRYRETGIFMLAVVLGVFCTLIPMLELSGFKNRRNLDTLYFFPIKRDKMALVHYLSGAIQIFTIYTASFVSVWLFLLAKTDCFKLEYMPLYYLLSLLLGFVMYSLFMFVFGEANTVADGVLFCVLWMLIGYLVMYVARGYLVRIIAADPTDRNIWFETNNLPEWGLVYTPINNLTVIFQDLIQVNQYEQVYYNGDIYAQRYMSQIYMFFIWGAVGIAAAAGYFITFKRKGAHLAGEISSSPFGYKLLIPLYGYSLLLVWNDFDILTIIVFALMLIGYIIYRRGFKIKVRDIIFIACGIIPLIFGSIMRAY